MHIKGNHKQNEKTTQRKGEIFANNATYKGLIPKIYKQLMQLSIKNNNKQAEDLNSEFFQRRYMSGQQAHEKMLNITITNHQGSENQNHKDVLPHTWQNGHHQKDKK